MGSSTITAEKARILSGRWDTKDRNVIESFFELDREKETLEALLDEPLTSSAISAHPSSTHSSSAHLISAFVELRDRIAYAKTLPDEYGSAPAKSGSAHIDMIIDQRYEKIYKEIIDAQPLVQKAQDMLKNMVKSYVFALKETYKRAKRDLKRTSDPKLKDEANAAMDKSALTYRRLSEALGFYSTSMFSRLMPADLKSADRTKNINLSSMRCWSLNRRAKKAMKRGTYAYGILQALDTNAVSAEEKWNHNKPKTTIFYKGRYLPSGESGNGPNENSRRMIDVDVRLFVTPNDGYIQQDLMAEHLMVNDPRNCNDDIMRIYRFTRESFRYDSDEAITGRPEYWLFPFELRHTRRGDCDDWANQLASYLIGAGVPDFRVRVVCGRVNDPRIDPENAGHSTVYVLSDNLMTWYHLNSTTPMRSIPAAALTDMPTSKDRDDFMGIGEVWFSYNNKYAWHAFEGTARQSYMKDRRSQKLSELL